MADANVGWPGAAWVLCVRESTTKNHQMQDVMTIFHLIVGKRD